MALFSIGTTSKTIGSRIDEAQKRIDELDAKESSLQTRVTNELASGGSPDAALAEIAGISARRGALVNARDQLRCEFDEAFTKETRLRRVDQLNTLEKRLKDHSKEAEKLARSVNEVYDRLNEALTASESHFLGFDKLFDGLDLIESITKGRGEFMTPTYTLRVLVNGIQNGLRFVDPITGRDYLSKSFQVRAEAVQVAIDSQRAEVLSEIEHE